MWTNEDSAILLVDLKIQRIIKFLLVYIKEGIQTLLFYYVP